MVHHHRPVTALAVVALTAAPLSLLSTGAAHATDRNFRCADAHVDFDVDRERGRFDVDVEIEQVKPGSRWRVVLRHDGNRFHRSIQQANARGKIDVDTTRPNTRGRDAFRVTVKKVGGPRACLRTIVMQ